MKNVLTKTVLALAFSLHCFGCAARQPSGATVAAEKPAPRVTPVSGLPEEELAAPEAPDRPAAPGIPTRSYRPYPKPVPEAFAIDTSTTTIDPWGQPYLAEKSLVIPRDGMEGLAGMTEDLGVMAHILEKAASGQNNQHQAMGILLRLPQFASAAVPHNMYIDGYGALFFLNVDYPLTAPPKAEEATEKEQKDDEWEAAKREMTNPLGTPDFPRYIPQPPGAAVDYDPKRVDTLKRELMAALKNAAHIKGLKNDETITIVVSSSVAGGATATAKMKEHQLARADSLAGRIAKKSHGSPKEPVTRLLLRVKKSDAEAFQSDKLTEENFRKKVTSLIY